MSFVAKIEARAYSRETEVSERVAEAILNIYPEKFRGLVELDSTKVEGQAGDKILIFSSRLEDRNGCDATLDYILSRLEEIDRRHLGNSLIQRVNENCIFFIRIDKQAAFFDNIVLAKGPDVISIQIHIRQYPRCRQDVVRAMLEERLRAFGGAD